MKFSLSLLCTLTLIAVSSCSSSPSDKAIKKKILLEYVCAETAEIKNLKIISTEKTENMMGGPAIRYNVSGEVTWPNGCKDFGVNVQPGGSEKFEKTVTLSKNDNGDWQ